ncbi:C2H2-type domain-containing protein [Mycena kentingensis (nom. inval.)]|nr:C2H2-type domain-containing protein [Mycena kentingensis (nom. inval.)]
MPSAPVAPFTCLFFNNLPANVILEARTALSRFPLLNVEVDRTRSVILKNPDVWNEARRKLARGLCTPLPPCPNAAGYYNSAYALWLFGGGLCSDCKKPTERTIYNFALDLRACSRDCLRRISRNLVFTDYDNTIRNLPWGSWFPRSKYTPTISQDDPTSSEFLLRFQHLSDSDRPTVYQYHLQALKLVQIEWQTALAMGNEEMERVEGSRSLQELEAELARRATVLPLVDANSAELQVWIVKYEVEKQTMLRLNIDFIAARAMDENISRETLLRTKTLTRVLKAFNRDLELITPSVWRQYRPQILAEAKERCHEKTGQEEQDASTTSQSQSKCLYCRRWFTVDAMPKHIVAKHKDKNPDELLVRPSAHEGRRHCRQCPDSTRVYNEQGLAAHNAAKHTVWDK